MWTPSELIAIVALFAVIAVMIIGLLTMSGTRDDFKEGERMMNWRILLQAVAVLLLIVGAIYLA